MLPRRQCCDARAHSRTEMPNTSSDRRESLRGSGDGLASGRVSRRIRLKATETFSAQAVQHKPGSLHSTAANRPVANAPFHAIQPCPLRSGSEWNAQQPNSGVSTTTGRPAAPPMGVPADRKSPWAMPWKQLASSLGRTFAACQAGPSRRQPAASITAPPRGPLTRIRPRGGFAASKARTWASTVDFAHL